MAEGGEAEPLAEAALQRPCPLSMPYLIQSCTSVSLPGQASPCPHFQVHLEVLGGALLFDVFVLLESDVLDEGAEALLRHLHSLLHDAKINLGLEFPSSSENAEDFLDDDHVLVTSPLADNLLLERFFPPGKEEVRPSVLLILSFDNLLELSHSLLLAYMEQ